MFQHKFSSHINTIRNCTMHTAYNISDYVIKPKIDCFYRLCMLRNQYKYNHDECWNTVRGNLSNSHVPEAWCHAFGQSIGTYSGLLFQATEKEKGGHGHPVATPRICQCYWKAQQGCQMQLFQRSRTGITVSFAMKRVLDILLSTLVNP